MANLEHVQIARQGSPAIARWREQHPGETLDFSGASLSNQNLSRASLSEADLSGADLIGVRLNQADLRNANLEQAVLLMGQVSGADLSGAYLTRATLRRADLSGAKLVGAYLSEANLGGADLGNANFENAVLNGANVREANLSGANLSGANLSGVDFNNADLTEANLTGANLGRASFYRTQLHGAVFTDSAMFHTVFGDCDLRGAIGVEEAVHQSASVIGVDTLFRSGGNIPAGFLRGAGAPEDSVVNYQRFIQGSSHKFYTCFICYCAKDRVFTQRLQADLQARGVRCWYFPADAQSGSWIGGTTSSEDFGRWSAEDVDRGIEYYDRLVVVCSADSLASERVREQILHGIQKQEETGRWVFLPISISDEPYDRRNRYVRRLRLWRHAIFDFREFEDTAAYNAALDRLVEELSKDQDASAGMAPVEDEEN